MLAAAHLPGLDTWIQDKDGHPPNECFVKCRAAHCAVARMSSEVESKSWARLMQSVRGCPDVSLKLSDGNEWVRTRADIGATKHGTLESVHEISDEDSSVEDFVDAEDGSSTEEQHYDIR